MAEDRMLNDEILLGLIKANSGGGGGTTNYNSLSNKPQIAGTELQGNKSLADLGIASAQDVKKEFIGTLAEWNALTTAEQKAYDTYQITDDYSEALLPNYSTTEQKTGQKWIDGKDIYFKTINFGALPNNTTKSVSSGLTNEFIVKMDAFAYKSDAFYPLPFVSVTTLNDCIRVGYNNGNHTVDIVTSGNKSTISAYVTLYYTKTA